MAKRGRPRKNKGPLEPGIVTPESAPAKKTTPSDLMAKWQGRVKVAKKIRKDWEDKYKVEECEKFILGFQWRSERVTDPVFNHLQATLLTMRPGVYFANPKFYVRPVPGRETKIAERSAAMAEAVLFTIGDHKNSLENAGSLAIWQNFSRTAILKVIYDPKIKNNPAKGEPIYETNEAGEPIIDKTTQAPKQAKDPHTGTPLVEPASIVDSELYRYQWVDAVNMLFPDDGPDQSRWSWIGEEVVVPLSEAKEDDRFPKDLRDQLVSNESRNKYSRRRGMENSGTDEPETDLIRYYECYDLNEKKQYIWADSQNFDDFLVSDDLPPGIVDHPYSVMQSWIPILGPEPSPWPVPYVFSWLDPQREYNIRRKQITEGCKRMARKAYYDDQTFPNADEAVKALQSGQDMSAVKVNSTKNVPVIQEDPPVPQSFFGDVALLQQDFQTIAGQSGAQMLRPEGKTATESSFVERASNVRETDLLKWVEQWLSVAGMKMKILVEKTLTLGMYIRMRGFTDEEFKQYAERVYGLPSEVIEYLPGLKDIFRERYGKEKVEFVRREDMEFEADVTVVPGSFRPHNLDVERSQWLQFLEIIGKFPQLAMSRELLRETASKFEYISERMLDELTALSQKMVQINANQAGRNQGGEGGQPPGAGNGAQQAMAGMLGGRM